MSVEAKVYSLAPPITSTALTTAAERGGLTVRLFEREAMDDGRLVPRDAGAALGGDGQLDHVVLGWSTDRADVTAAVERAVRANDKATVDRLGREGELAWCELSASHFDYEDFWQDPDERAEYEESVEPVRLAAIKASRSLYSLRGGVRPRQNGELLVRLAALLREVTGGVVDE